MRTVPFAPAASAAFCTRLVRMPFTRSAPALASGRRGRAATESRCRVDAPLQRDPLGHERVDVNRFEHHRGIAGELREGAHAPLERVDLAHHDLRRLIDEGTVGWLPGLDLFHRQSNRRERVLQLVRGLARQRLPAGHLGQYTSRSCCCRSGHVVERFERCADFIARAFASLATGRRRVQSPAANALSAAVSC